MLFSKKNRRVRSTYTVECKVSMSGITIMIWGSVIPHNCIERLEKTSSEPHGETKTPKVWAVLGQLQTELGDLGGC